MENEHQTPENTQQKVPPVPELNIADFDAKFEPETLRTRQTSVNLSGDKKQPGETVNVTFDYSGAKLDDILARADAQMIISCVNSLRNKDTANEILADWHENGHTIVVADIGRRTIKIAKPLTTEELIAQAGKFSPEDQARLIAAIQNQ